MCVCVRTLTTGTSSSLAMFLMLEFLSEKKRAAMSLSAVVLGDLSTKLGEFGSWLAYPKSPCAGVSAQSKAIFERADYPSADRQAGRQTGMQSGRQAGR